MKENKMVEIISSSDIRRRNKELALEISKYYKKDDILVIGALKGCIYFLTDLTKLISNDMQIEFVDISSYQGTKRGEISFKYKIDFDVKDKKVLIIEDIIDTGNTINFLYNKLKDKNPKEIKIVSFLFKPMVYKFDIDINWIGFEIQDDFVVGYGLDYNEKFRNRNSIFKINE